VLIYLDFFLFVEQMQTTSWRTALMESTRGRILDLLRTKEQTVNELAAALRLTDNAVRGHLLRLNRDGLARQSGMQPGFRRPHATYSLTPEAEEIFPKSYGVLLDLILIVISRQLSPKELRGAMREVGRRVADNHLLEIKGKSRKQRIEAALRILKDLGGSASFEQSEGKHFICGNGCPLAAATSRHPEACLIAESLLSQIIGAPVKEHCIHGSAPSCRFEIRRPVYGD
jgi:predicted ArsR family transcriptional regulator